MKITVATPAELAEEAMTNGRFDNLASVFDTEALLDFRNARFIDDYVVECAKLAEESLAEGERASIGSKKFLSATDSYCKAVAVLGDGYAERAGGLLRLAMAASLEKSELSPNPNILLTGRTLQKTLDRYSLFADSNSSVNKFMSGLTNMGRVNFNEMAKRANEQHAGSFEYVGDSDGGSPERRKAKFDGILGEVVFDRLLSSGPMDEHGKTLKSKGELAIGRYDESHEVFLMAKSFMRNLDLSREWMFFKDSAGYGEGVASAFAKSFNAYMYDCPVLEATGADMITDGTTLLVSAESFRRACGDGRAAQMLATGFFATGTAAIGNDLESWYGFSIAYVDPREFVKKLESKGIKSMSLLGYPKTDDEEGYAAMHVERKELAKRAFEEAMSLDENCRFYGEVKWQYEETLGMKKQGVGMKI